jgi:hypothetical protein
MSESSLPRQQRWKTIEDFPEYQIGDFPNYHVKKYGAQVMKKDTQTYVSIRIDTYGYRKVDLNRDGKRKTLKVAILVAKAFIPNPHNLPEVDHQKQRDRTDDDALHLKWVTRSENNQNQGKKRWKASAVPASEYKGVSWDTSHNRWKMQIMVEINGKKKKLQRYFKKESEARDAYDAAAIKHYTNHCTNLKLFGAAVLARRDQEEKEREQEEEEEPTAKRVNTGTDGF